MIARILLLISFLFLVGCKEVTFKTPQPKGRKQLSTIPKSLQGKYLALTDEGEPSKDTIIVSETGYRFVYINPADASKRPSYDSQTLGDSAVLKSFKGYYFLNLNEDPEWILRVIKQDKNGDLLYMTLADPNVSFPEFLKRLSREVRVDSLKNTSETIYQIDPSPSELVELINKGYFTTSRLIKVK